MDKIEHSPLSAIPVQALTLRIARTPIRMHHAPTWRIDKVNPDHDLIFCLSGRGHYQIGNEEFSLCAGQAMLINARERFRGHHGGGGELYTGLAQHFSLELFGSGDMISQMRLARVMPLRNWDVLEPLVRHYRATSDQSTVSLAQHHQFMVLLLAFLEDAFLGWKDDGAPLESRDQLSLQIMLVASRLSTDLLREDALENAMDEVPYNPDYFRRAFRNRIGMTPQKFLELKRMEYAVYKLGTGQTVKETAAELGYMDPYFFSRMFKKYIGASPSAYRLKQSNKYSE